MDICYTVTANWYTFQYLLQPPGNQPFNQLFWNRSTELFASLGFHPCLICQDLWCRHRNSLHYDTKFRALSSEGWSVWVNDLEISDLENFIFFIFLGSKITADGNCTHEIKRCFLLGRKAMTNLDSTLKSRNIPLPTKVRLVKAMAFPAVTYACESWTVRKVDCRRIDAFWTVMLGKTLESLLDCKEIQPVPPKGNQSWRFIGRIDAEAETPLLWPPDAKNWLTGKDPRKRC